MNAKGGPSEARRAPGLRSRNGSFDGVGKEGASADSAEEMKDTTGVSPWRLHFMPYYLNTKQMSISAQASIQAHTVYRRGVCSKIEAAGYPPRDCAG